VRPVAFVTGASRGIGKAIAVHLARSGHDVAISARTVKEGEQREHSSTVAKSDTRPIPGSLTSPAELVEAEGGRAMAVPADLVDRASLGAAVATVLSTWGRIDVLVNNGRFIGPGHMDRFVDTPLDVIAKHVEGNFWAPLVLTQQVLPGMLARGSGTIVNITSGAGYADPPAAAGEGGWGISYGSSKAALHRVAGILHLELHGQGINTYNVQPGFIATERMATDMAQFGFDVSAGEPPDVVGAVVAWLASDPEAVALSGGNIEAQQFCHERGLLPGWPGPRA
jgi:NAD(P)-dependent dehydrogenase (short-subunit alcohol dehydrogenase family)